MKYLDELSYGVQWGPKFNKFDKQKKKNMLEGGKSMVPL